MDKLILIDDDAILRRAVSQSINWEQHGVCLCGVARDAIEGLELIARHEPDVVITDIRMPQISGIELCQILHREYPSIKTILLSGHEEFEYAQKAIESRVFAYLTKPVKNDRLVATVQQALAEKQREDDRQQLLDAGMPLVRSKIFREAFGNDIPAEKLDPLLKLLGVDGWHSCVVAVMRLSADEPSPEKLHAQASAAVQAAASDPAVSGGAQLADLGDGRFAAVLFAAGPQQDLSGCMKALGLRLCAYFESEHRLRTCGVISQTHTASPLALCNAYAEASDPAVWSRCSQLDGMVFAGDYATVRRSRSQMLADRAVEYLRQHYADPELSLSMVANELDVSYTYLSQLFASEVGQNFQPCLLGIRMEKARELIARDDLKSYEIAERVGFSNAYYFGACFKKHTGMTVSEYKKQLHP